MTHKATRPRRALQKLRDAVDSAVGAFALGLDTFARPHARDDGSADRPGVSLDETARVHATEEQLAAVKVSSEQICERAREIKSESERRQMYEAIAANRKKVEAARAEWGAAGKSEAEIDDLARALERSLRTDPKSYASKVVWADCLAQAERDLRFEIFQADVERPRIVEAGEREAAKLDEKHGAAAVRPFRSEDSGRAGGAVVERDRKRVVPTAGALSGKRMDGTGEGRG